LPATWASRSVAAGKSGVPTEIAKRIRDERSAGRTLRQIAASLDADGIPTAHGGARWWPSVVRGILRRGNSYGTTA
jgi:hypothetical protein